MISWRSVLLVEATGIPVEINQPATSYWHTLSPNVVLLALSGIRTQVRFRACMGLEMLQCVHIVQLNTNLVENLKKLIDVFPLKIMFSFPIIIYPHRINRFINIPTNHAFLVSFTCIIEHVLNIPISHFCCPDCTYCHPGLHPVVFSQTPCLLSQKFDKHPSHDWLQL